MVAKPSRSALYVPASNTKALGKASSLASDVVILDLEDGVAPEAKGAARSALRQAVREGSFRDQQVIARINGLGTEWGAADLAALLDLDLDGILLPKVNHADDIRPVDEALANAGSPAAIWAMIETCRVIPNLGALSDFATSSRLAAFVLGTNDLAKEMRVQQAADRRPLQPVFSLAVASARTNGLLVLDGVCNTIHDPDRFRAECEQALEFGFDGKTLIHPGQINVCNEIFSPSVEDLKAASLIVEAFALPENRGRGAIKVNGVMAELLHLEQAERLLAVAAQIGATGGEKSVNVDGAGRQ